MGSEQWAGDAQASDLPGSFLAFPTHRPRPPSRSTPPPPDVADTILRIESQTFVRQVDWFPEIDSTNSYAQSIADRDDLVLPRLIWADRQMAGRGRAGNVWWSAGGALTFSLLVEQQTWTPRWSLVSLLTGFAIAQALSELLPGLTLQVKWPNDVYLEGRKVCGVLIEPAAAKPTRLIIGIGINVANSFRQAPTELRQTATAICDHRPDSSLVGATLLQVLHHLEIERQRFGDDPQAFLSDWPHRCFLTGKPVCLTNGNTTTIGICRGIDAEGHLLIETPSQLEKRIAGTVRVIENRAT